ncbi:DUF2274 domain-containing protein [Novosphingobium sp.]
MCSGSQIRPRLSGYIAELVPAMLAAFLESDRNFTRARDAALRAQK